MKQVISDCTSTKIGYRIDQHFINQFDVILKDISDQSSIEIKIKAGSGFYTFESTNEFFREIDIIVDPIQEFTLCGHLPSNSICSNKVILHFDNTTPYSFKSTEINYDFDDEKTYRCLKEKITALLKNQRIPYSYVMSFPYYPFAFLFACFIYPYVSFKKLIPPKHEIPLTIFDYTFFIFALYRRKLFPKYEFDFGSNVSQNSRSKSIRNFIIGGVIFTIAVNLFSNFVYDLFKP